MDLQRGLLHHRLQLRRRHGRFRVLHGGTRLADPAQENESVGLEGRAPVGGELRAGLDEQGAEVAGCARLLGQAFEHAPSLVVAGYLVAVPAGDARQVHISHQLVRAA